MKVLEVSRYKNNFADHQLPFVTEQGETIAKELRELDNGNFFAHKEHDLKVWKLDHEPHYNEPHYNESQMLNEPLR